MKNIYKTKTFWGGLVTVVTGIGIAVQGDISTGVQTALTGLLSIFIRDSIRKI